MAIDPWDDREVHLGELLEAQAILRDKGIEAEMLAPAGDPASTIERVAVDGGFDAIVIGSRGLGALSRGRCRAAPPSTSRPTARRR